MAQKSRKRKLRIPHGWWAAALVVAVAGSIVLSWALYNRAFNTYVPVRLTADRAGLMMEAGNAVKMRGLKIGHVASVSVGAGQLVTLQLAIDPHAVSRIPANVEAEITASTAFGNKYVQLIEPEKPATRRLSAGETLRSRNVSTEVNTVFDNLVSLLNQIEPAKLNAVLTTLADGLRGRGNRIGEATTAANQVLGELNQRSDTIGRDWRSLAGFSDTYSAAAHSILATLDAATTTSATISAHSGDLDAVLLNVIGLARSGADLVGTSKDPLIRAANILEPTTNLLLKYNPEITCLLTGAKTAVDAVYDAVGGNGRTLLVDAALLLGNDPYVYPDNLPIVAAQGGPGGTPGCGSLPDVAKNFPVRYLVTNTGYGTGMDIRPNPGLGHPCWMNFFPVTRAVPEPPSARCPGPPSPGLVLPPPDPPPPDPASAASPPSTP